MLSRDRYPQIALKIHHQKRVAILAKMLSRGRPPPIPIAPKTAHPKRLAAAALPSQCAQSQPSTASSGEEIYPSWLAHYKTRTTKHPEPL
jgi:hypothetical protein